MPSGKKQPGPVHRRYDAYLFIVIGLAFIVAGIIGAVRHVTDFQSFFLICGVVALTAVSFIVLSKGRHGR